MAYQSIKNMENSREFHMESFIEKLRKNQFLFEELVKRDFKKKYKRTVLGMFWSMLSPLLTLLVMKLVFTEFFGRSTEHYTIYIFAGTLVFSYFNDATNGGMTSIVDNSGIFTKINTPKYLFLLSKNVSSLINFGITLVLFFIFCIFDGIHFGLEFFMLVIPVICLVIFNVGVGSILSALYVFFKDIKYLYGIFTLMLMYLSAIFYTIDSYEKHIQYLFYLNPIYVYISYFREIVIGNSIPSPEVHFLAFFYAAAVLLIGIYIYKKYNQRFLYYL